MINETNHRLQLNVEKKMNGNKREKNENVKSVGEGQCQAYSLRADTKPEKKNTSPQ